MNRNSRILRPDWPAPAAVHAATTLRTGGVSSGAFSSLNMAMHVGDDPEKVRQNRKIIRQLLKLPSEPVWLEQVHSARVVGAAKNGFMKQADASYTDQKGVVLAVMTADCLPLLACSVDGLKVAAIHAGWRGLLAGIISNTLSVFEGQETMIWLGPAIGTECFEVGPEVRDAFLKKSEESRHAFKQGKDGKWLADIYQLARNELKALGITRIYGGHFCTVTDHERFYSYRRDTTTGRMATLIWRD
ncbi:MAG: peptidoglycan editing factor PgeF [Gammaproteobacteria bacterium]